MKIALALLATIMISCSTTNHKKCDAYSKENSTPKNFDQAENWIDSIHRQNIVNKL